ncbi:MAG TPA: hypothetical protein VF664_02575 [Cystobacter sp.]
MQTPGHAVLNLALLGGYAAPSLAVPILVGAVLPDVPIAVLYLRERYVRGLSDERIWSESYQRPFWLNLIHGAHSLPLSLGGGLVALALGVTPLAAFFASVFLHALADFPLHVHDAHRHFLPFSQYRFISPISYWDVRYHGRAVALGEALLVLGVAAWLWPRVPGAARAGLATVTVWYAFNYWKSFPR